MAHLSQQTAIFSPSVARAAASTAKDWSYVDSWLQARYAPRKPPAFERNQDTLKALLALASLNEQADEEREQLSRIEDEALNDARNAATESQQHKEDAAAGAARANRGEDDVLLDGSVIAEAILDAIGSNLTKEGTTALDAMAAMAVELGSPNPTPQRLGSEFVDLQGCAFDLEQTLERVVVLQRHLDAEIQRVQEFGDEMQGKEYQPDVELPKRNLELQRKIKTVTARLPELKQQIIALERSTDGPVLTVEEVKQDEVEYLELLGKKKDLDSHVKAFAGLPPDIEAARQELEALRTELRDATERRDAVFEGLVERESPVKIRKRP